MSIREQFQRYADAFEETYLDDDWSRIEPFFTEDAMYEGDPGARGRVAVLARLKAGVDAFDRKMDARIPDFQTPSVEGNTLELKWAATYQLAGAPDLTISGLQTAVFEGDRIARLGGGMDPEAQEAMGAWMATYGAKLEG